MPDKAPDRLLVTFALLAYNQEHYIRDAVEGALRQACAPLEIILSDDCSSDRTFEIMREMAAAYRGPHHVRLRRSAGNAGLMAHINALIGEASGEIVVLAAGDDVSFPNRTQGLTDVFCADPDVFAVFSGYASENRTSCADVENARRYKLVSTSEVLFEGGGLGRGATYAYRSACFSWPWKLPEELFSEDKILPLRAAFLGKVAYVPGALMFYREGHESLGRALDAGGRKALQNRDHVDNLLREIAIAHEAGKIGKLQARIFESTVRMRHGLMPRPTDRLHVSVWKGILNPLLWIAARLATPWRRTAYVPSRRRGSRPTDTPPQVATSPREEGRCG